MKMQWGIKSVWPHLDDGAIVVRIWIRGNLRTATRMISKMRGESVSILLNLA